MENENKKPLVLKIFLVLQWTFWTLWTVLAVAVVGVLAVATDKLTAGVADRTFYFGCVSVTAAGVVLCLAMGAFLLVALGRGRSWARWYVQGAERGQALCMEKAGDCFANGYGVDKGLAKARAWYEKAVSQGASMTAARKLESLPICGK